MIEPGNHAQCRFVDVDLGNRYAARERWNATTYDGKMLTSCSKMNVPEHGLKYLQSSTGSLKNTKVGDSSKSKQKWAHILEIFILKKNILIWSRFLKEFNTGGVTTRFSETLHIAQGDRCGKSKKIHRASKCGSRSGHKILDRFLPSRCPKSSKSL